MRKVLCNVLYQAELPVFGRELGGVNITVGLFKDQVDAAIASETVSKILSENASDFDLIAVDNFDIKDIYVPETKMKDKKIITFLYDSVDEFVKKNTYTNFYETKKGARALKNIVDESYNNYLMVCKDQLSEQQIDA